MKKQLMLLMVAGLLVQTACSQKNEDRKARPRPSATDTATDDKSTANTAAEEFRRSELEAAKLQPTDSTAAEEFRRLELEDAKKGLRADSDTNSATAEEFRKLERDSAQSAETAAAAGSGSAAQSSDTHEKFRQLEREADRAAGQDQETKLKMRDVKVLLADTLKAVKKGNLLFVANNALRTSESAEKEILSFKRGMICQAELSSNLANGDILQHTGFYSSADKQNKNVQTVILVFKNADKKELQLHCKVTGELTERAMIENFEMIIEFKDQNGKFSSGASEDPALVNLKTRSLKIVDLEKFAQTDLQSVGRGNLMAIADGKLIPSNQLTDMVFKRQTRAACIVSSRNGELKKDIIYKDGSVAIENEFAQEGIATISYTYKASDNPENNLVIACTLRNNIPVHYMFETFKGILEYGADKDAKVPVY